jgi:hypothetical protein
MRLIFLFLLALSLNFTIFGQQKPFSGEITYKIERVDVKDSSKAIELIYARDSIIKVVNFSSDMGKQELIKHLRLNKSYLLIETPLQNFAVRTNEHLHVDTTVYYTFKKKFGTKKIAGIRVKKLSVKHKSLQNELTFYYAKNIPAKYANTYSDLPGLPVLFYIPTEKGLFRYTLSEIKFNTPPLQLFLIPGDYKKVSFDEFTDEFTKMYENEDQH